MKSLTSSFKQRLNPTGNPIIVKELRSRMRGARAFIILTAVLILMASISYALYQLVILTSTWSYNPLSPQIGQTMFSALVILEMLMICLITPAITAGAISGEHENLTYEMLLTTPLKPTRILWGKLVSALSYVFLLIFAAIPMASLVFIYGGVSLRDMVKALIVLICTAIMLGTIGIFMSTWLKRTARATVVSYLVVLTLLAAPTFIYGIAALVRQAEPPRWLLIPSPVSALFSAISPSTSLGSSSLSLIGGFSMLMAGNIGFFSTNSIPRPLYHYTLPLYGLITLVLYFLATRLVRPAKRWRIRVKELLIGLIVVLIFLGSVALAFVRTTDRYENIGIFAVPTPFMPMPVEPMMDPALMLPVSEDEAISAYASVLWAINNEGLFDEAEVVTISRLTYFEPSAPEISQIDEGGGFTEILVEGITLSSDELPIEIVWVDDFASLPPKDLSDPDINSDALILFSNLNPMKTGNLSLLGTVYYADQASQNLSIVLANNNGSWEVVSLEYFAIQEAYPEPARDEINNLPLSFEEIAQIYAAAISQAYLADNPTPEEEISELYLLQTTGLALEGMFLPPEVQNQITDTLGYLPFSVVWVENRADDHINKETAVVTFGPILPLGDDGAVEVMIDFYFDAENSLLITYILEKIDGEWQVTDFGGMG